ncbi:hypothetical protein ACFL2V_00015 [Pseudomonadota bacterium]
MIYLLEERLIDLVKERYAEEIKFAAGPAYPPDSRVKRMLAIAVANLETAPQGNIHDYTAPERSAVYQTRQITLQTDGNTKSFQLPNLVAEEKVIEVVTDAGQIFSRGDDYTIESGTLHFYKAPEETLQIELQGTARQGYQEQQRCQLAITITSWTKKAPASDQLTQYGLVTLLDYFYERDLIKLSAGELSGFSFNLRNPVVNLMGIERTIAKSNRARFIRSIATLHMHATLEMRLVRESAVDVSKIDSVAYTANVLGN